MAVDRPELEYAEPKTKNKASTYNNNFSKMINYVEACMDENSQLVGTLSNTVTDVNNTSARIIITKTDGVTPTNGNYSEPDGSKSYVMGEYDNGLYYVSVGNTNNNGNWASYRCGTHWKKQTYNNANDLIETEYIGTVPVKMLVAKSATQALYFMLPDDIVAQKAVFNFSISPVIAEGGGYIGNPPVRSFELRNCYLEDMGGYYLNKYVRNRVVLLEISAATAQTTYDLCIHWHVKQFEI